MSKEAALRSSEADILLLQKLRGVGPAFATVLTRGFLPILRQPSSVRQLRSAIGTSRFSSLSVGRHLLRNRPELGADSGDVARSFRDYVARCSDMMSPG